MLRWYRRARRDLPWRHTNDPYRVWISEAMLQQTRVETVIPYYHRFLDRFPDVAALAGAELDDVLGAWQGLGYYSRARNLKRAAEHVVECCGGELPDTADALRELPGVGRYTAGAVASIAFDRPEPIVDGNVARVLSRLHGLTEDPKSRAGQKRLWEEAERLVRGRSPGDLNQALMELGATVCTPRSPECPRCPVRADCVALRGGDPEALPAGGKRPKVRDITAVAALVERRGRVLAVRRPETGLLGGLWDLPGGDLTASEDPDAGLERTLRERVGLEVGAVEPIGAVRHVFTHRRLSLHVYRCRADAGRVRLDGFDSHRWVTDKALAALPAGNLTRKALALAEAKAS
ncbi:MAG: A/G-specific adenine glycosylase [Deltaproteobacteria bacterium]|nr:A/G-specific adenine glycosylase [Deltaproteobacteria bacterium]MBW2445483.1 A/G-specific adenine glycosylase [Deltaproteobacteria bacterium]